MKLKDNSDQKLFFIYKDWYLPRYHPKMNLLNEPVYFSVFKHEWSDYMKHLKENSIKDVKEVREDWFSYNDP